jgi:hypothetical protein
MKTSGATRDDDGFWRGTMTSAQLREWLQGHVGKRVILEMLRENLNQGCSTEGTLRASTGGMGGDMFFCGGGMLDVEDGVDVEHVYTDDGWEIVNIPVAPNVHLMVNPNPPSDN